MLPTISYNVSYGILSCIEPVFNGKIRPADSSIFAPSNTFQDECSIFFHTRTKIRAMLQEKSSGKLPIMSDKLRLLEFRQTVKLDPSKRQPAIELLAHGDICKWTFLGVRQKFYGHPGQ